MTMLMWAGLRHRWLEHLLGATAVALVVAGLVTQRAVTAAADDSIHDLAHRLGKNMLVLPAGVDLGEFYRQRYSGPGLSDRAPDEIRRSPLAPHIRAIEARLYGNASEGRVPVIVVGDASFSPPAPAGLAGAYLAPGAARNLGAAAGSRIDLGPVALAVLGVAPDAPEGLDDAVFVPLEAAQRILGRPGEVNAMRLGGCWCRTDVAMLASEVEKLLPGSRAVTVAGMVKAQTGSVATMKRYASVLLAVGATLVAGVVAALVASQARRRRRELGLLVAVGAPPEGIAWSFTLQATLAGALGGLAGWSLALPAAGWLGTRTTLGAALAAPGDLLLPAVVLSALASALAAFFPARRAAALDPTEVLREI